MKKSAFLTFIFACWPGAGQMYLGYTKRGFSLMTIFLLLIGLSGFLDLWIFAVLTPVIWFFAFLMLGRSATAVCSPAILMTTFCFFPRRIAGRTCCSLPANITVRLVSA